MPGYIDKNGNYYEADRNLTGAIEVPIRPSAQNEFVGGAWVARQKGIEEVRGEKLAALEASKARLDRLRYGGTNNGTKFEITDPAIMQELTLGWISIKDNPVGQFTIRDDNGVEVTFTSTALNLALPLITGAKKQISDRYWQRRAVVENANSVAAINAVDAELGRG